MKKEIKKAYAKRIPMEVPCLKHGKPSYRWTNGYIVENLYPPVTLNEARDLARAMGFDRLVIED